MYTCCHIVLLLKEGVVDVGQRRFVRFLVERGTCVDKVIVESLCAGKEIVNCLLESSLGNW